MHYTPSVQYVRVKTPLSVFPAFLHFCSNSPQTTKMMKSNFSESLKMNVQLISLYLHYTEYTCTGVSGSSCALFLTSVQQVCVQCNHPTVDHSVNDLYTPHLYKHPPPPPGGTECVYRKQTFLRPGHRRKAALSSHISNCVNHLLSFTFRKVNFHFPARHRAHSHPELNYLVISRALAHDRLCDISVPKRVTNRIRNLCVPASPR